ncbi:hypothetical protein [Streptomyces sp. LN704]|uniref:hypothetical protein n=1 Tax=Streptomyces sp. LN704 TaxID=3112982 RepID=UPI003718AF52
MPGIEVGLSAVFDAAASVGEPGEEGAGLGDLLFRLAGLGASQRPLLRFAPQAPHLMPGDEVPKTPTVFGVLDDGESFGQPTPIEHELSVDGRQDAAVHQQVAQMSDGSPGCLLVQLLVGERDGAGGQAPEKADDVGVAEPDESALGPVHLQQDGDQWLQRKSDVSGAVVEEAGEGVGKRAAFAETPAE